MPKEHIHEEPKYCLEEKCGVCGKYSPRAGMGLYDCYYCNIDYFLGDDTRGETSTETPEQMPIEELFL